MNEKVKMLYEKYGKLNLNINEMSKEIGISASKSNKLFSEIGEKEIIKKGLLPRWRKVGNTRLWSLESIINWNFETEIKTA
jgi:hypothetical protein